MHKTACNQCERTFTKDTVQKAEQALRMHISRAHTGHIDNKGCSVSRRPKLSAVLAASGPTPRSLKRRAVRAVRNGHAQLGIEGADAVLRFCPQCGLNLNLVSEAIHYAFNQVGETEASHEAPEINANLCFCPKCGLNLGVASRAMRIATSTV